MESDLQQQPQVNSSGLTRYRSAPSSLFNNIIDREFYEHIFNRPSSPETERVFSCFMNGLSGDAAAEEDSLDQKLPTDSAVKEEINQHQEQVINNEHVVLQQSNSIDSYNSASQSFYQSSARPPLPNQNTFSMEGNRLPQTHIKTGGGNHSNLIRHSSSPAGLFSQINMENGYDGIRGMGTLGAVNNSIEEAKLSTARRLKNPQNYSSGRMSSIAEIGDKVNRENNPDSEAFAESHGNDFITGFQVGPWDDSALISDNVSGLKRFRENDAKPFSGIHAAETQNETGGQSPTPLAHHLSLPNTSAEMAAIEKFLQFSDSIPCKIRAKRGCATHPRSIAERVRRTKISERMRKLQDLVPNMDKQTNTADMLDLAVDYIKDLQKQVQDQVLSSMQQKLDNLCELVNSSKEHSTTTINKSSTKDRELELNETFGTEKIKFVDCGCWHCEHHSAFFNELIDASVTRASCGNEVLQYKTPFSNEEQEERRMSDLSDWASSVTSAADIQLNSLAEEQDIYNLKRDCEEKDITIKELTTLLNSSEVANYKRIAELEDIVRRKNSTISKLKKDLVVLEQKVVQLSRLRRPSFSTSGSNGDQLPHMTDNLIYDMESTTSSSSSDSDCSPTSIAPDLPGDANVLNQGSASTIDQKPTPAKVFGSSRRVSERHSKSRSLSPHKEVSSSRKPYASCSSGQKQLSARGDLKKNRRRSLNGDKSAIAHKRWV